MAEIRTRICSFVLDERGYVYARLDPGAKLELEDARECIAATFRVAGEKRRPVLVDMRYMAGETRAARFYFVSEEAVSRYSAVALLIKSPVSRVIGTFFLRLSEHKVPTRLYTDEEEARRWLMDLVKMSYQDELDIRLGEILEVLLGIARQDFSVRTEVRGTEDVLDAIAVGLNMLSEELGFEVASRRELERALTDLKAAQGRLVHAGKLAAVGQLASGVAHEINNPATSLEAALTIVKRSCDELSERLPSSERELLGVANQAVMDAQEAVDRIRRLTGDIRTFARADDEALRPLSLDEVVDISCRLAAPMVRPRAELVLNLAPVPTVLGNRGRLGQVVTNLLVNAAQAIPDDDPRRHVVEVSTFAKDGKVVLSVEDSGSGVAPALRSKIFEPFFTTKPEGAGTGLGLSLVSEIVLAHNGSIEVSSGARGGARFDVSFPAAVGVAVPPSSPVQTEALFRARVLLVDDEAMIVRLLGSLLSDRCDVVSANSGKEAIEIIERDRKFDVILCDLHMRETDGIDVYEAVQRVVPKLLSRFVFTTGGAVTARGRAFLDRNDPRILPKPFRVEELFDLIGELIASPAPER